MFSSTTKLLIILLAMLQLVAPFTHAHASGELSEKGLHIPGLEHLTGNNDSPAFLALNHPLTDECTFISVGAAIKQNKVLSDTTLGFYLPIETFSLNLVFERVLSDRDYPQPKSIYTAHYTLLPSRASPL